MSGFSLTYKLSIGDRGLFFVKYPTSFSKDHDFAREEFALLAVMNLLGVKTPTEMALLEWEDGGSLLLKRMIGEEQGEKNQLSEKLDEIDLDNLIRMQVANYLLCASDIEFFGPKHGKPVNIFNVRRGKFAIYDPELSSPLNFPLFAKEDLSILVEDSVMPEKQRLEFEMNDTDSIFFFPFRSFSKMEVEDMATILTGKRVRSTYKITPLANSNTPGEVREFFSRCANPLSGNEERKIVIKAMAKLISYYESNKEKIERILQENLTPFFADKILSRLATFNTALKIAALELGVDLVYESFEKTPDSKISRKVEGVLSETKLEEVVSEVKSWSPKDPDYGVLVSYLGLRKGEFRVNIYNAADYAIKPLFALSQIRSKL